MNAFELRSNLDVDEMAPSELLAFFDASVNVLGPQWALTDPLSDAMTVLHTCEAQYAAAYSLDIPEEVTLWSGLRETLRQRVEDVQQEGIRQMTGGTR